MYVNFPNSAQVYYYSNIVSNYLIMSEPLILIIALLNSPLLDQYNCFLNVIQENLYGLVTLEMLINPT